MHPLYKVMLFAWIGVAVWVFLVIFSQRKVHPKALFYLFFTELWERFSYYGMRAILVLYMTSELIKGAKGGFGFEDAKAYGIYAAYGALVYTTPILGGLIADKIMGFRKAIIWGAILMAAGQFTLMLPGINLNLGSFALNLPDVNFFFTGLALLIIGNGFFKPNISSLIGKFYGEGDPRRDGAFTLFYMGINIGAFLTPLTCGTIGELEGWKYGFMLAGIGMVAGLIIFLIGKANNAYQDKGYMSEEAVKLNEEKKIVGMKPINFVYLASFLAIPLIWLLINHNEVVDILLAFIGVGMIIFIFIMSFRYDVAPRQRLWVIIMLLIFTAIFWSFFELAGSALTLFTDRNVDKTIMLFGNEFTLTTTFFIAINPLCIMFFAPIYSWMWLKLGKAKIEPPAPVKFAIGLILLGVGFLVLNLGKGAAVGGMVAAIFVILMYLFHTLGELALSPVGLSMVTKLAPAKLVGFIMGFWFLSSAIAHQAGKHIANATAVDESMSVVDTMNKSLEVFTSLGFIAMGSGVLLFLLSPIITRWMHGIR